MFTLAGLCTPATSSAPCPADEHEGEDEWHDTEHLSLSAAGQLRRKPACQLFLHARTDKAVYA